MGTPSLPHDFASQLREALTTRGISRKKLASTVGVSQNTVTSWAKGRYRPDHGNLMRIATALEMTLDELHGGPVPENDPSRAPESPAADTRDDDARRIVARLATFDFDASLREIRRVTPDLMRVLEEARAYAARDAARFTRD